jgi:hypothetical protein
MLIAFGGVVILAGRLGDLPDRRRVFLAGLTVLTRDPLGDAAFSRTRGR